MKIEIHRRWSMGAAVLGLAILILVAPPVQAETSPAYQATIQDIQNTLGSVPTFLMQFPPDALPGAWGVMKSLQLAPDTAIPGKYKEMIGVAVAAQIPCQYCVYFHTEAAKLNGASDAEIHEALAEAALTRFWSTVLNGSAQDKGEFRAEVTKMLDSFRGKGDQSTGALPEVSDARAAYAQMTDLFGFVPSFMKAIPERSIAAAWNEFKACDLNPNSVLPDKYKSLISIGIASQIPCEYCVYVDTEFAKFLGATQEEITESIGMSAITRHWSTYLNGISMDPETFHREADAIMAHVKGQMAAKK